MDIEESNLTGETGDIWTRTGTKKMQILGSGETKRFPSERKELKKGELAVPVRVSYRCRVLVIPCWVEPKRQAMSKEGEDEETVRLGSARPCLIREILGSWASCVLLIPLFFEQV
jgi:hypothetical protein